MNNGYIDDFELAYLEQKDVANEVQVRSSSRVGYLDVGVNGKRLNYIAKDLRELDSNAEGVNADTHRGYFIENSSY